MVLLTLLSPEVVGGGLGRADLVALARRHEGGWEVERHEVGWGARHDTGAEGLHHARIARFLLDHGVRAVVAGHVGPGMTEVLQRMGVRILNAQGALDAVLARLPDDVGA